MNGEEYKELTTRLTSFENKIEVKLDDILKQIQDTSNATRDELHNVELRQAELTKDVQQNASDVNSVGGKVRAVVKEYDGRLMSLETVATGFKTIRWAVFVGIPAIVAILLFFKGV